jgi:hypothetical protein
MYIPGTTIGAAITSSVAAAANPRESDERRVGRAVRQKIPSKSSACVGGFVTIGGFATDL